MSYAYRALLGAAGTAVAVAACMAAGSARWAGRTRRLLARLEASRLLVARTRVDFRDLNTLPPLVRNYFEVALQDGQPLIAAVGAQHSGIINLGEEVESWKRFTSDQLVITSPPGFVWNARVMVLPGLSARVHDAYLHGEGVLNAALLGLYPLVNASGGGALAEAELMRFLAEAIWYPTALLPSQGVQWESNDAHSAFVTLNDRGIRLRLLFSFGAEGTVEAVTAEERARFVSGRQVMTPWRCRPWNYHVRKDMRVPLETEVAWLLPSGPKPYWRGRLDEIEYEFND